MDLEITSIPKEFDLEPEEAFDPASMPALYDFGHETGLKGVEWSSCPPDFVPWPSTPQGDARGSVS